MQFTYSTCRKKHNLDEISFGADRPSQGDVLSEAERTNFELGKEPAPPVVQP